MNESASARPKTTIGNVRRDLLIRLAEVLADDFTVDTWRTDPLLISEEHGLTVSFNDYGDCFDGMLHHGAGRFHIYCNAQRCGGPSQPRARFTLSHELGHFFIPEHHRALRSGVAPSHPSFCNKSNAASLVELEADLFASRLLMPDRRFQSVIAQHGFNLDGVRAAANSLGTSLQSTILRFQDSNTFPCAFVWWRNGKNPWFGASRILRLRGFNLRIPSTDRITVGSATAKALSTKPGTLPDCFQSVSVASEWFSGITAGAGRDFPLCEEALATAHGTATWITARVEDIVTIPSLLADESVDSQKLAM